jgi:hypothetical protein
MRRAVKAARPAACKMVNPTLRSAAGSAHAGEDTGQVTLIDFIDHISVHTALPAPGWSCCSQ